GGVRKTSPAILAIHGQIDKEYNAKVAREINDKNYKKRKPKKEKIDFVKETDDYGEMYSKYRRRITQWRILIFLTI
ncbi:hypothetical protein JZO81_22270, partial [Enterococcus hulanensis]|uniref:hypothetical protein n=1 Tax=Enterococcus hulanensis TaxID=2559929 RepID=UPI001A9271AB